MINHFRASMPRPIIGVGHSFGGAILCNLAFMHPRLLSTIVLLDPVIQGHASAPTGPSPAQLSAFRRDYWPSRADAEASFRKSKFYQSWDPRALDQWCEYGIRETPSRLYPNDKSGVTLSTTKHQECFTFLRPSWEGVSPVGEEIVNRRMVPDMGKDDLVKYPFYRAEPPTTLSKMATLRPSVLFIVGGESPMSTPSARKQKMDVTGTGLGGSGGAKEGKVAEVVLHGVGHLVAMEATGKCADSAACWIGEQLKVFEEERREYLEWTRLDLVTKQTLSEEWKKRVGGPPVRGKPKSKM